MCHLIDHIYFSGLQFERHAWGPTTYSSLTDARKQLIPSLTLPSDHFPVVVDFSLLAAPATKE